MSKMTMQQLADLGQSIWLDYINRAILDDGKLKSLIDQGLRGMTSNPSIFNQAIGSGTDYDENIIELKKSGKSVFEIYDSLTIKDIQDATDLFKPVYDDTNKLDGYVSLEINPLLAHKIDEQIEEGLRLFKNVNRPNVMIKVPSTKEGFQVFEELIAQGVNVNVTLIFSLAQYENTVRAYFKGLNRLAQTREDLSGIRSVASIFISRIDTAIDNKIDDKLTEESDQARTLKLRFLKGKAAVANSRIIFEKFKDFISNSEFELLSEKKAPTQRVLWGSTSTKNPQYSDIKYVTELIASPTVNTIPEKTLEYFLDHGSVKDAFTYDVKQAQDIIQALDEFGIDINQVCDQLLVEGCKSFDKAFEELLDSIEKKAVQLTTAA